jgi:hypothetical protein
MPGFGAYITPPTDVIEAMNSQLEASPMLMQRSYRRAMVRVGQNALSELSVEPGTPHYPLLWKSARQRRFVMALLREQGNLPYQRTHMLSESWRYLIDDLESGGEFSVFNTDPTARYVIGDDAQPYHLETGWTQAAPVLMRYMELAESVAVDTWFTIVDEFGGIPR